MTKPSGQPATRRRKARVWWLHVHPDGSGTITGWRSPAYPGIAGTRSSPSPGMEYVRVREVLPKRKRK